MTSPQTIKGYLLLDGEDFVALLFKLLKALAAKSGSRLLGVSRLQLLMEGIHKCLQFRWDRPRTVGQRLGDIRCKPFLFRGNKRVRDSLVSSTTCPSHTMDVIFHVVGALIV